MPRKLALLIGVSTYGEGFDSLNAPPNDVAALQRVLENPELGGFDQVTTLIDPGPIDMQRAILKLFSDSTRPDLILLFFSGHGITNDNRQLYFATGKTSKADYLATSVPAQFIQGLSDNGNYARRQVIILDCCYSGAFARGWQHKGDVKVELRELGTRGRVVLTSSSSAQLSFEQEDSDLSLYTQYLVEGIETGAADGDQDGAVRIRELHDYAKRKVQEVKPNQKPDIMVMDDEGYDIPISQVRVDAALQFRQSVEKCVDQERGEILDIALETLQVRANRLGVSTSEAEAIIASVLEPSRRRLRNLERYRQKYTEFVEQQYPLAPGTLEQLRDWQQEVLGLEDSDVAPIQQAINRAKSQPFVGLANSANGLDAKATTRPNSVKIRLNPSAQINPPSMNSQGNRSLLFPGKRKKYQTRPKKIRVIHKKSASIKLKEQAEKSSVGERARESLAPELQSFRFDMAHVVMRRLEGVLGFGAKVVCDIRSQRRIARFFSESLSKNIALEMVEMSEGIFWMGQTNQEQHELIRMVGEKNYRNWYARELPQHEVNVASFFMGKYPVTQAQYEVVMGQNPATKYDRDRFVAPDKPVVGVSWEDAMQFCDRLSQQTGRLYRLPSEAEWEYACRAGTQTPFHFGETIRTDLANYRGTDWDLDGTTVPGNYEGGPKGIFRDQLIAVGSFPANAFGLFDMHGNVWEWCLDHWHEDYQDAPTNGSAWNAGGDSDLRVIRGGSWCGNSPYCRSAVRVKCSPDYRVYDVGFRVCCASA